MKKRVKELPKEKVENIKSVMMNGSPNVGPETWLSIYPCEPMDVFDNTILLNKSVAAGIVASGSITVGLPYAIDIVRQDGSVFDIDRYLVEPSGNTLVRDRKINKTLLEHHSDKVPDYYRKN